MLGKDRVSPQYVLHEVGVGSWKVENYLCWACDGHVVYPADNSWAKAWVGDPNVLFCSRSKVNLTSFAVNCGPSCQVTPVRRLTVQVLLSLARLQPGAVGVPAAKSGSIVWKAVSFLSASGLKISLERARS